MERVFISGMGVVSCLGNDRDTFWANLTSGNCGLDRLQLQSATTLQVEIGGQVRNLDLSRVAMNERLSVKRMDRCSQFAVYAAREALEDAGLPTSNLGDRCAVVLGCAVAGLETCESQKARFIEKGASAVSPFAVSTLMPNAPAANISLAFDIHGSSRVISSACSSSGQAMIDALDSLRLGRADVVVTGGAEATLTDMLISAFSNMKAMCRDRNDEPKKAMRPFDAHRTGFVMSEGAAVLIFETETHLRKRGGTAWAEVLSGSSTSDAFSLVRPDPQGTQAFAVIRNALEQAGLTGSDIADSTYVSAHGTSTRYNDAIETEVIKALFGSSAYHLQMSSIKSMLGHMLGAACAVEMAACCRAVHEGILPPTINYETLDPECDLNYVPNMALRKDVRYAINNSFGFGGHNVCLILQSVQDNQLRKST
jgi:3-oxoacyl-[acyl-carrier-protein] synthase II